MSKVKDISEIGLTFGDRSFMIEFLTSYITREITRFEYINHINLGCYPDSQLAKIFFKADFHYMFFIGHPDSEGNERDKKMAESYYHMMQTYCSVTGLWGRSNK